MRRFLATICLLAACNDVAPAPSTPTRLQIVSGDGQTGVPGYLLANPLSVKLIDDAGNPVAGDTITFTELDTTGVVGTWHSLPFAPTSIAVTSVVTDSQGIAQTTWRLGAALPTQQLSIAAGYPGIPHLTVAANASSNLVTSIGGTFSGLCAVDAQGRLGCWAPPRLDGTVMTTKFVPVTAPVQFTQVVLATYGTAPVQGCALASTGHPWCFTLGANATVTGLAELGGTYPALTTLAGSGDGTSIGAVYCGLAADGQAWCWGVNRWGQLGDGTFVDHNTPQAVASAARFTQIDVSGIHACALTSGGDPWCWGRNDNGEAPPHSGLPQPTPTQVTTALHFARIFVAGASDLGVRVSCGIGTMPGLYCWGDQSSISTTNFASFGTPTPTAIAGAENAIDITEISRQAFLLTSNASILATASQRDPVRWSPAQIIRDIQTRHGSHYLCGTALHGRGTLCVIGYTPSDNGPWNLPSVIGVPLP